MTNNNPEDRGQGVILDLGKAPIISPNNLEKSIDPKEVQGGAGQGRKQEKYHLYASQPRRTITRFGTRCDRFRILPSLQRLNG
jgi:hypothetical protein